MLCLHCLRPSHTQGGLELTVMAVLGLQGCAISRNRKLPTGVLGNAWRPGAVHPTGHRAVTHRFRCLAPNALATACPVLAKRILRLLGRRQIGLGPTLVFSGLANIITGACELAGRRRMLVLWGVGGGSLGKFLQLAQGFRMQHFSLCALRLLSSTAKSMPLGAIWTGKVMRADRPLCACACAWRRRGMPFT
eukprot:3081163-Rhodomonas_salina.2